MTVRWNIFKYQLELLQRGGENRGATSLHALTGRTRLKVQVQTGRWTHVRHHRVLWNIRFSLEQPGSVEASEFWRSSSDPAVRWSRRVTPPCCGPGTDGRLPSTQQLCFPENIQTQKRLRSAASTMCASFTANRGGAQTSQYSRSSFNVNKVLTLTVMSRSNIYC